MTAGDRATPTETLGPDLAGAVAALAARALTDELGSDVPSPAEIVDALYGNGRPVVVRGDPEVGVVATELDGEQGFVKLLAVDPGRRRQGHGRNLLRAAEADLAGAATITVGADAPYFLFPGVESTRLAMHCLLESRRYARGEGNFNMAVDLDGIPSDPGGTAVATAGDREELVAFMAANWANWGPEALRALDRGSLVLARDAKGISGFCATDVNRAATLGPVAVRLDLLGQGTGKALLLGGLHRLRAAGHHRIEVLWVGPIRPYGAVGGRITRVFYVWRRTRRPAGQPGMTDQESKGQP